MTRRAVGGMPSFVFVATLGLLTLAVLAFTALPQTARPELIGSFPLGLLVACAVGALAWRSRFRAELAGPVALACVTAAIDLAGGLTASPLAPTIYVVVAIAAAVAPRRSAIVTGVLAGAILVAAHLLRGPDVAGALASAGFVVVFGVIAYALLARAVEQIRVQRDAAVASALDRINDEARDFRLIGAALGGESQLPRTTDQLEAHRRAGSVRALRRTFVDTLELARVATGADTALLFLLDGDGDDVRLAECVCADGSSPSIVEGSALQGDGAITAVLKTKRAVNMRPRAGGRGLGYRTAGPVGAFVGVPVLENGRAVGVIAVDRAADHPFRDLDEVILQSVAGVVDHGVETERIFRSMDRAKYEHERFFEALALLNEALTLDAGAARLAEAVSKMHGGDFTLVVAYDEATRTHRVLASVGAAADGLAGTTFTDADGGLIVMAVKNGHALPHVPLSAQSDRSKVKLYGDRSVDELASVKVLPLKFREGALGAVVVGSTVPGCELTLELFRMIETVARHGATTLANAKMYAHVESMATTDGLTGLVNHRRFKELLTEALVRASRFSRQVSVVMIDADHFKSVNDTYGHPVGDLVLVRIARILEAEARRTDVVARYGGEEFILVLDETDSVGAEQVAERIRERIQTETIQGAFGRVRVTASLGVCTWRGDGSMDELLENTDQALYAAKHGGRNQVVVHGARRRPQRAPSAAASAPVALPP